MGQAESRDFETVNLFDHKDGPLVVTWDTGRRCNYDCTYCPSHRHDNFSPHASLQELQSVGTFLFDYSELLCKYKTKDQLNVSFTGGEPTVNPKFIEFGQWLRELYTKEYKDKFKLKLGLTSNGAFGEKMAQSILQVYDNCTISYHVEAHKNLKKQVIRNIYFLKDNDFNMKINVMFHAQYFDECIELCRQLTEDSIVFVPRMIGDEQGDTAAHIYTDEQLQWMKDYWKSSDKKIKNLKVEEYEIQRDVKLQETIVNNTVEVQKTVEKFEPIKKDVRAVKDYATYKSPKNKSETLGRPCCGGRIMETGGKNGCWTKTKFLDYQRFQNWQCSVNWFFLHIEQQTDQIFHHQTCQARFDGTRGAIGSITESDKIITWLKDKLETKTMPIIQCPLGPNKLCGCGLCSPKSTELEQLKNILPRHLNDMEIFA